MPKDKEVAINVNKPPRLLSPAALSRDLKAKCQVCKRGIILVPRNPLHKLAIQKDRLYCCLCGQQYCINSPLEGWALEELIRGTDAKHLRPRRNPHV